MHVQRRTNQYCKTSVWPSVQTDVHIEMLYMQKALSTLTDRQFVLTFQDVYDDEIVEVRC